MEGYIFSVLNVVFNVVSVVLEALLRTIRQKKQKAYK